MKRVICIAILLCTLMINISYASEYSTAFMQEYEEAVFDKFNSFASDNGLAGTKIYVEGTVYAEVTISNTYCVTLKEADEKYWLVCLWENSSDNTDSLSNIMGKELRVYGEYAGLSNAYHIPVLSLTNGNGLVLTNDKTDAESILWFPTLKGTIETDSDQEDDFQKELLLQTLSNGDITFGVPNSWYNTELGENDVLHFYPEEALVTISRSDGDSDDDNSIPQSIFCENGKGLLEGINKSVDDFHLIKISGIMIDGKRGYYLEYDGELEGITGRVYMAVFSYNYSRYVFSILEFGDIDYSSDFQSLIDNIHCK